MCLKPSGQHKKPRIPMTARRVIGVPSGLRGTIRKRISRNLTTARKNRCKLLRRYDFELCVGAVGRPFVGAPSPELSGVTKPGTLHMFVCDLGHQFGPQWLPG